MLSGGSGILLGVMGSSIGIPGISPVSIAIFGSPFRVNSLLPFEWPLLPSPPTLLGEREEDCHQVSTAYPWRQNALASVEGVLAAGCHEPADVLAIDSFPFFFSLPRCRNDGQPFSRVISVLISTPTGTALGVYQKAEKWSTTVNQGK